MFIHVVNEGETLWQIAGQYGADIEQVILLNDLVDPDALVIGQSILIADQRWEYVVQSGDNLATIAQRFGVSLEDFMDLNGIEDPTLLFAGQLLVLPYVVYHVRPGDSLWSIAERLGVSVEAIIEQNNLPDPSNITVGQALIIPAPVRETIEVNAYLTDMDQSGKNEVLMLGRFFTYLSPFMYSIREDGTITSLGDEQVLEAAVQTNTAPLLVLTNYQNNRFDSDLAASILRDEAVQDVLIHHLIEVIEEKGYVGINIDFEYVYPEDRESYNEFLRKLTAQFHERNLLVSTALAPKESRDQKGLLYEAHDYRTQGEIVDFIIIMTYEWGWAGGSPRAIAPLDKMRDVLDYAVTEIPPEKIMLGIPLYGRDWKLPWVEGTLARTISPVEAIRLAQQYGATIQYDEVGQSPFFHYQDENGQNHEVWFEDARSMQAKYNLLKDYQLRGASYWVLGNSFPQNWSVLQSNFKIDKIDRSEIG